MPNNRNKKISALLFTGILFTILIGCVTTHYGHKYISNNGLLTYSCAKDRSVNHPFIKSISCAIENTSQSWVNVQVESFSPQTTAPNKKFVVLKPEQIKNFMAAHQFELHKNDYNSNFILAGLVIGGAIASGSANSNIGTAGLATAAGAVVTGATLETIKEYRSALGNKYQFGQHHLLGATFELPPASFVRKTILIEASGDSASPAWPSTIEICFSQPEEQCSEINFWSPRGF